MRSAGSEDLGASVDGLIAGSGAASVAIAWLGLDGRPRLLRHETGVFHAASTMKVPVLVEVYRRDAAGTLDLDDRLPIRNAFLSVADGSSYALDPADDSETSLYGRTGGTARVRELARLMVVLSSNLATNLLVDLVGAAQVSATMQALGLPGLVVRRGVEDEPAYRAGINNTVTALDLARLMAAIGRGAVVSPATSEALEAVLLGQRFNEGIPAGLPPGTHVAHKTGSISGLYHDAAIVRPAGPEPYALVVLTSGLEEERAAPSLVARISALVARSAGAPAATPDP